ncbi:MAG: RHS repeat-associated core domain-containing protein [Verrucomicrobia bacterium]|nr:RHS repeat-associated core domain-containing protein [Verrucomicrobiota bacterium]
MNNRYANRIDMSRTVIALLDDPTYLAAWQGRPPLQFGTKAASLRTAVEAFAATAARQSAVITGAALDKETITYPGGFTRILDRNTPSLGRPTGWQLGMADTNGALASAGVENTATYGYSETTGRLETVSGNSSGTFTYGYETNSSLIKTVTRPGLLEPQPALRVTNTWEPARDVLLTKANELVSDNAATDIASITYTVNALGQRTHATNGTEWAYDTLGQLTSADDTTPAADRAYQYDAITEGSVTFAPTYDDDGNQENTQIQGLESSSLASCVYHRDAENRLTSVTTPTGEVLATYTYDAQSRLISSTSQPMTNDQSTTLYLYDGWNRIAEYQLQNSSFNLHTSYLWGLDLSGSFQGAGGVGGLLSVNRIGSPLAYPAYDGNGNITEYLGADGTVLAHFEYDPFGNTVVNTDATNQFAYRFSTKPIDPSTGLYYYGYRWYDPHTGRWPSRDPIGENGGANLYGFVGNDGVDWVDCLGLRPPPHMPTGDGIPWDGTFPHRAPIPGDVMTPRRFEKLSKSDSKNWKDAFKDRFGDAINRSALANCVPKRLIAALIANEMIEWVPPDGPSLDGPGGGGIGPAQVSIDTAIEHGLTDVTPLSFPAHVVNNATIRGLANLQYRNAVKQTLTSDEGSVEAAARLIREYLKKICVMREIGTLGAGFVARFESNSGKFDPCKFDHLCCMSCKTIVDAEFGGCVIDIMGAMWNSPDVVDAQHAIGDNNFRNADRNGARAAQYIALIMDDLIK